MKLLGVLMLMLIYRCSTLVPMSCNGQNASCQKFQYKKIARYARISCIHRSCIHRSCSNILLPLNKYVAIHDATQSRPMPPPSAEIPCTGPIIDSLEIEKCSITFSNVAQSFKMNPSPYPSPSPKPSQACWHPTPLPFPPPCQHQIQSPKPYH